MNHQIIENIQQYIKRGESPSPFLCIGKNMEMLSHEIQNIALEVLQIYNTPKVFYYTLESSEKSIKIQEIKQFLAPAEQKPSYPVQIFIIEDIAKLTLSASNSMLKILEEPPAGTIFFLLNESESGILDTILSRVQVFHFEKQLQKTENNFFMESIHSYIHKQNTDLLQYFFGKTYEIQEYLDFFKTLIQYTKKEPLLVPYLDNMLSDMNAIAKNNVSGKYMLDSWLLTLRGLYE